MPKKFFQNDWDDQLQHEFEQPYYAQLRAFLKTAYKEQIVYPPMDELWTAFRLTPFQDVKVVILGQDPYHGEGQAHGLSFSVNEGVRIPPSLRNMFKELTTDMGCPMPQSGNLSGWAKQGVLLLNTVLTVQQGKAHSHRNKGWEQFTDAVIQQLSAQHEQLVFILWGRPAQQKKALIDLTKHTIVESVHPSPLSAHRGFFGSAPYSTTNAQLIAWGKEPIRWCETNDVPHSI
ncbi:MAG TPA: uracil-DNA glycosylase [Sporosarcina sp.]|nr:uracil-DNA glycosylase [Sporosarcina sp.]